MTHHETNSPFAIHNHMEIVRVLSDLAKHRVLVNLTTHEGTTLVTTVLYVSGDRKFVCIDVSKDEAINQKITDSQSISFETQSEIKVRWHSTHLQLVAATDGLAFSMHIPSVIDRIQRREYFRLPTPQGGSAMICRIPVEEDSDEMFEYPLHDISAGGIGLTCRGELPDIFSQGAELSGCSMDFPGVGRVPFKLRVCGIWKSTETRSGEQLHRIGLQFVDLSRGAANVVQRHITQLQAEQITPT